MSGVWVFKNGIIRLVENPYAAAETSTSTEGRQQQQQLGRKKVLVYLATEEIVSSYNTLQQILTRLGWERYYGHDPNLFQFHKRSSIDLISLPSDFSKFNSVYMYDIVVKNPRVFTVRPIYNRPSHSC